MFLEFKKSNADKDKAERLYFTYRKLMFNVAYGILGDEHLAEDAVNDSFARIMKNLHKIDEENCPKTRHYLVIICRNVAIDIYNKRLKLNKNSEEYDKLSEGITDDPVEILINNENMDELVNAITELDEKYRDVFILRYSHGMNAEEISQSLGISVDAVKKRLTRAKKKLAEKLRKGEEAYEK